MVGVLKNELPNIDSTDIKHGTRMLYLIFLFPSVVQILIYLSGDIVLTNYIQYFHVVKYALLLPSLVYYFRKNRLQKESLILTFAFFAYCVIALVMPSASTVAVSSLIYYFGYTLLMCMAFKLIGKPKRILDTFRPIAYVGVAEILVTCIIFYVLRLYSLDVDYMTVGNEGIVYAAVLIYYAFKDHKTVEVALSAITVIFYMLFLSRGSFGALLFLIVFFVFSSTVRNKRSMKWMLRLVTLASFIVIFLNLNQIVNLLSDYAIKQGWSFGKLLQANVYFGNIFQSDSRDLIKTLALKAINDSPVIGHGPMSSYGLTDGHYCHNMVLDLYLDFGVIVGTAIVVSLAVLLIKLLFFSENKDLSVLVACFCLPGIVLLQFSSTWYHTSYVFVLIIVYYYFYKGNNTHAEVSNYV